MLAHMRKTLAVLLGGFLLAGSPPVLASGTENSPLGRAAMTEAIRVVATGAVQAQAPQPPAAQRRSWIGRHPALFGALVGTAGGAALGSLEDCRNTGFSFCSRGASVAGGALLGAGVGSLTGFFIGRARK